MLQISIHIMLHFIGNRFTFEQTIAIAFQYILCYASLKRDGILPCSASYFNTSYVTLHLRNVYVVFRVTSRISIHPMLRFIPRKYKIPLLRDIYILAHKSAFFNTFYQPLLYFFCQNTLYLKISTYISRFPTFLIHLRLVKIRTITTTLMLWLQLLSLYLLS